MIAKFNQMAQKHGEFSVWAGFFFLFKGLYGVSLIVEAMI